LGFFRESFRNPPCAGKNFGWVKNLPTKKDLWLEKIVVFLRLGMEVLDLFTETLGYFNSPKKKSAILGNKLASYEGGLESQSFRGKILKKKMPIPNSVAFPPTASFKKPLPGVSRLLVSSVSKTSGPTPSRKLIFF